MISGSSTSNVDVLTVVVVPLTVRLPVIVTLSGKPIVTVAFSLPEPETSISLLVPLIPATKLPVVSVPRATLLAAIVVDKVILPVPSNDTPEAVTSPDKAIVRAFANAVAVDAFPVSADVTVLNWTSSDVPTA